MSVGCKYMTHITSYYRKCLKTHIFFLHPLVEGEGGGVCQVVPGHARHGCPEVLVCLQKDLFMINILTRRLSRGNQKLLFLVFLYQGSKFFKKLAVNLGDPAFKTNDFSNLDDIGLPRASFLVLRPLLMAVSEKWSRFGFVFRSCSNFAK
jgi:hypothetical protein